jgi:glucose/mannose transport system substrate-binding protein
MQEIHRSSLTRIASLAMLSLLVAYSPAGASGQKLEVFHYLDTRTDAQRVAVLRGAMKSTGYEWQDFTVASGWGSVGESILRLRVQSHNAPMTAMMKSPLMRHWAGSGALVPLDDVAAAQRWDEILPKEIASTVKHNGRYYAVPLNIHRINWLWINERILKESGAAVPTNWDEFFIAAEAMKRAGYAAVAYFGRDSQNLLLFEMVALGVGGPAFHRKALIEYDSAELAGPVMERVLATYRRIKGYTEQPANARISMERGITEFQTGKVGMHLMGDWANPAFYPPDKAAPFTPLCVPAPGTNGTFLFTSDAMAMFRNGNPAALRGQRLFAAAIMSPQVQRDYSLRKGSIPARQGADLSGYEACALKTAAAFRAATLAKTLEPTIWMTASRAVEDGIQSVVTDFWNDDHMSATAAMRRLVAVTRRR